MKRFQTILAQLSAISLLLGVIWLGPAVAIEAPAFSSLGQITAENLRAPGAMDLDSFGNLYVADSRGGLVHKFDQYGQLSQSFELGCTGRGLAVTPDGTRLYVAREQAVVVADVASGEVITVLAGGEVELPEFGQVGEIDLDEAGNVYVVDQDQLQVKVYAADGSYLSRFGEEGVAAGQFKRIGGLSINAAGQVVVLDPSSGNGQVHVFSLDEALDVVAVVAYKKTSTANFGLPVMQAPCAVTFDSQGRAYFLDFMTSRVRVTDPGFGYLGAYADTGYSVGKLNNVIDAVYDSANNRLFVGCDTSRIEILSVDGGQNPVAHVNRRPAAPAALSPLAGEVDEVRPTLVFAEADDPDDDVLSYTVVVTGAEGVVFETETALTSVVVNVELAENASYSWTVQASDGKLSSPLSGAGFVVNAVEEAPTKPVLTSPVDGEVVAGADVLAWTASEDLDPNDSVVGYNVEIALDLEFTESLIVESVELPELVLGDMATYGDLVDGATYFWRVVALDNETLASEPSDAGQFIYDTTAVSVTANMPGAKVYISGNHAYAGQSLGVVPLELRDFAPGTYSVVVERAGFEPFVAQVTLGESDNAQIYAALVPALAVKNLSVSRRGLNSREGLGVSGDAAPFLVDFDNDGDLDMLAAAEGGAITLFANMQVTGRDQLFFDAGQTLGPVGVVPYVVDWNNDGRKDLLAGQADGSVKLYLNSGLESAPAFSAGKNLLSSSVGLDSAPAVLDYNGDGAKDLLVGNASGQVLLFVNQGDDANPAFAENDLGQEILKLSGNTVPFPIDWDADGQKEILVTNNGEAAVYAMVDGQYQAIANFRDKDAAFYAVFPIAIGDNGKQLLAGEVDGSLVYVKGKSRNPVASFKPALQEKVAELGAFVAESSPDLLNNVTTISLLIEEENYDGAADAATTLATLLGDGPAQKSALELSGLCQW